MISAQLVGFGQEESSQEEAPVSLMLPESAVVEWEKHLADTGPIQRVAVSRQGGGAEITLNTPDWTFRKPLVVGALGAAGGILVGALTGFFVGKRAG